VWHPGAANMDKVITQIARLAAFAACLGLAAFVSPSAMAKGKRKNPRDAMIELNKKALESYATQDYDSALDFLATALKEAREAGLDDDKLNARTYVHLGAVYWTGFHNHEKALESFTQAKQIRPDIQLTPAIETPELRTIFELATVEPESPAQK
jgi:tetratricopeptide (TPR) repeat protein